MNSSNDPVRVSIPAVHIDAVRSDLYYELANAGNVWDEDAVEALHNPQSFERVVLAAGRVKQVMALLDQLRWRAEGVAAGAIEIELDRDFLTYLCGSWKRTVEESALWDHLEERDRFNADLADALIPVLAS